MISEHDYHNVRDWLTNCRRPLILSHRRADGDALGALAAMTRALRKMGLDPAPVLFEPFPARYDLLRDMAAWRQWDEEREALTAACDAVVILDTCATSQLEPVVEYLPQAPRILVVDHHPTRDAIGTRPGDLQLFDETAAAVCLLLAEWVEAVGIPLDAALATALFVGIATDSGWFRFSNTDARLLRVASRLAEAGAAANPIHRALFQREPAAKLRLTGRMLQGMELHADGRLAVLQLRAADFAAVGADRTMTEDLVNEAGRLDGVEAIIFFTEEPDGSVHVNFRSKESVDVSALASRFGGGGHKRAAGARPSGTWDEVVPRIIAATLEALD